MSSSPSDIAALSATTQKAVIGSEIITKTLDALNQYGDTSNSGSCDKSGIINKTLDALNQYGGTSGSGSCNKSGTSSDMAASYDFQKSVLSAAYSPKGVVADISS